MNRESQLWEGLAGDGKIEFKGYKVELYRTNKFRYLLNNVRTVVNDTNCILFICQEGRF